MATININMRDVKNANSLLPSIKNQISSVERGVGLLRWRVPEELQNNRNVKDRLNNMVQDLRDVEQRLGEVYSVVNEAVYQYQTMEQNLRSSVDSFL